MEKEQVHLYRIMDLDQDDRPRERLAKVGAEALNHAELLAILLRVGIKGENAVQVGQRLLHDLGGLRGIQQANLDDLRKQKGVGFAKAVQLKAAIELGRRLVLEGIPDNPVIHSPQDAANLVQYEMSALAQEHLRVILLDTRNRLISIEKVYIGSLNASSVRIGELFKAAIQKNAANLLLVHNHPSGDPTPSPEDIALTRSVIQAGKLLDVEVLDHLVIGKGRFISLKERGLGFNV
ncbi:MAG TPA: DNA repair protein RadC [Anaerolineaceae bacterium]